MADPFEKLFGPPPEDMDDKMWKLHWTSAVMSVGAVAVIVGLIYLMWSISTGMGPQDLH
jgi:hypothetical protein